MSERRKLSWTAWGAAIVLLSLPALYLLSMGPISSMKRSLPPELLGVVHGYEWPFAWSYWNGPEWWREVADFYLGLWP